MANGGGNFGGDGSLVWEVSTNKDREKDKTGKKRKKVDERKGSEGKTNAGIDADVGDFFVILLDLPIGVTLDQFRESIERDGDRVRIRLQITKDPKQVEIHWSPDFPGTTDGRPITAMRSAGSRTTVARKASATLARKSGSKRKGARKKR